MSRSGEPVTADDLGVGGAMTVLMKEAIQPTLMQVNISFYAIFSSFMCNIAIFQSVEGTPVFVHAGPFANIAHGNSSIVADQIALKLAGEDGFCITEAGFGADIGMEKFFDIKCRYSGLIPQCTVIVATVRALKMHGGGPPVVPGKPLSDEYKTEHLDLLRTGTDNLLHHIRNALKYGVKVVVAVNRFSSDTNAELDLVCALSKAAGAFDAVVSNHWEEGGRGAVTLGEAVSSACAAARASEDTQFKFLYPLDCSIKEKIETVCRDIYGAAKVEYSELAEKRIESYTRVGYDKLPICMAKTQYSLSTDPALKCVPTGFTVTIRDIRAAAGAGYVYPICGDIMTIPGLPTRPGFYDVDIDLDSGKILGLF